MAKYTGNSLTNLGKDLLARAVIGGESLTFTKVELGKGVPAGDPEELTQLVETFKTLSITSTAKLEGGSYRVRTAFSNAGITEDTYLREIGVFARGEDGVEILYSYCYTNTPDLIPAEGAGVLERVEDVITYISNAANVNAVIDQSKVYATIKDLTEGLAGKEDKFDKNSGFNLDKTDNAEIDSSILLATAKAVKKAWDKAMEALGFTNTNKAAILNNTEQIENLIVQMPATIPKEKVGTYYALELPTGVTPATHRVLGIADRGSSLSSLAVYKQYLSGNYIYVRSYLVVGSTPPSTDLGVDISFVKI
ncbi:hypothetical protein PM10SUCC1_28850 [Propionigenium maris DSM 9537]|uniref:Uncharacterized protein n=1 Tax=Propionigenium maris DSM 9537 TaxID=1123000 RepID=A0A9W6GP42_9FUSO|nr:phage tail protein [Propionigenium maris]GLI57371.1 hypothetical protein PM10SUCC1_28850 [Propionigenium maris DSM 9537]